MSLLARICSQLKNSSSQKFWPKYRRKLKTSCLHRNDSSVPVVSPREFVKFDDFIQFRRTEASRSLLVQVQSEQSCRDLHDYCTSLAPVNSMYYYTVRENHFVLVEFQDDCLNDALASCCHADDRASVPVVVPVVWFKAQGKKKFVQKGSSTQFEWYRCSPPRPTWSQVCEWLSEAESPNDELILLHKVMKLDELGSRLRFFSARQLELAMSGMFPHCAALPFGSSVNSFGMNGSDLDLLFLHQYRVPMQYSQGRLVYHTKASVGGPRGHTQRQMEFMADLLQIYMPGCVGVKRILNARVPIVKFTNDFTGVDCDLSLSNMSGFYMSEMLYLFGELDPQARILACFVKHWASAAHLTNPVPGRWVTNFTLTLLCLFYLQSIQRLPPLDLLIRRASTEDERITEDINCTFCRDLTRFDWSPNNSALDPPDIVKGFFDFYTKFDFNSNAISVISGSSISKPDFSPLYVVNPLERGLNVAKNISSEELERLKIALRTTSWQIESEDPPLVGLLRGVPELRELHSTSLRRYIPERMVAIKDLFNER